MPGVLTKTWMDTSWTGFTIHTIIFALESVKNNKFTNAETH
jgi:hypothetical protein